MPEYFIRILFFAFESLPRMIIIVDANLCNLSLRFVNIFHYLSFWARSHVHANNLSLTRILLLHGSI